MLLREPFIVHRLRSHWFHLEFYLLSLQVLSRKGNLKKTKQPKPCQSALLLYAHTQQSSLVFGTQRTSPRTNRPWCPRRPERVQFHSRFTAASTAAATSSSMSNTTRLRPVAARARGGNRRESRSVQTVARRRGGHLVSRRGRYGLQRHTQHDGKRNQSMKIPLQSLSGS